MGIVMSAFSVATVAGVPSGLFLAAHFDWHMPFFVIAGVSALLAGIGFTVSLLVSDLALVGEQRDLAKAAVLLASVTSAVLGAVMLSHRDRFHSSV